jgi:hypothetical protein
MILFLALACKTSDVTPPEALDLTAVPAAGTARGGQVTDASALFGGIDAEGQVGDYKLHNAVARFIIQGDRIARLAQVRTTNDIGQGPQSGSLAFNNTNGAGGIVCSQAPAEAGETGPHSAATAGLILFKFGVVVDPSLTDRLLHVELPAGGISRFGQAGPVAGWFATPDQAAAAVSYVPVVSRGGTITVRGAIPAPGSAFAAGVVGVLVAARRRRRP